jgi:polyisoprenoid-binding protein YceI
MQDESLLSLIPMTQPTQEWLRWRSAAARTATCYVRIELTSPVWPKAGEIVRAASVTGVIAIATLLSIGATAVDRAYRVDPSRSRATIHVGKAGALSFIAGHTHEVGGPVESGSIEVDLDALPRSRVTLVIATAQLKVSAKGEPEGDAPRVQEAMSGEKVLDVAHHPRITFESSGVTLKSRRGPLLDLIVSGSLTIRDVSQPVTVPVHLDIADASLVATGRFAIKQSAFGIKPISVGGVVAVKDTLDIDFSIYAAR